jgi:hypothetical protein
MANIVLGTEQRLIEIGEEMAYLSRHTGVSIPIPDDKRRRWARAWMGSDGFCSIKEIQFEANGRFLPDTQEGAYTFPLEGLYLYSLKVTFHNAVEMPITNLEDRASIMKCNLRGLVSLFPPTNSKDHRRYLPTLQFPVYNLPIGDILKEVCLIAFIHTLYADMYCTRYLNRAPQGLSLS